MSATLRWVPVLVTLALATACSSQDSGPAPTPMGHIYISTKVTGAQIPGGGPLTLNFSDDRISADSGCNSGSGPVVIDGSTLRVAGPATTMMGCLGAKSRADSWQTNLLESTPTWSLNGDQLTVTGSASTVTLIDKKVVRPDLPLTGTSWIVTTLLRPQGQVRSQTLEAVSPTLTVAPDGQVTGSAGCNQMNGTAQISGGRPSGNTATFRLSTTRMMCASDVMDIERQVLEALNGATTVTVDSDTLTVRNNTNNTGLILRAE